MLPEAPPSTSPSRVEPSRPAPGGAGTREDLTLLYPLRVLANFVVVWAHMRATNLFGVPLGVPLFLLIMFGLASGSTKREPLRRFARRKGALLMVPWMRWSLVYVALALASDLMHGEPLGAQLDPSLLIVGGHPALWFLPFAAVAIVVARALGDGVRRFPAIVVALVLATSGIAAFHLAAWVGTTGVVPRPLHSWLRSAPLIFWGVALGVARGLSVLSTRRLLLVLIAALAVLGATLAPAEERVRSTCLGVGVAAPLAALGFGWCPPVPRVLRFLGGITYGIYLVHPLVAKVLATTLDVFSWPLALHAVVVWSLSAASILLLRRMGVRWRECVDPRHVGAPLLASPPLHSPHGTHRLRRLG